MTQPVAKQYRFLLLLILCFLPFYSDAYVFRVLGVSGKVWVKNGNQEMPLRPGSRLENNQTLVIESGYCGLVHSGGKILELRTSGSYPVEELSKKVAGASKSKVSDKYFDYVLGQLSKKETEDVDKNVRKFMDVPGSVDRSVLPGSGGSESQNVPVKVFAFKTNDVRPRTYTIEWEAVPGVTNYTVNIKNRFDEVVFQHEVSENRMDVDFSKMPQDDSYTLRVTYSGRKASKDYFYLFKVGSAEDFGLQDEEGSPAAMMLNGIICEENHLFLDALRYYQHAQKLEPGVGTYAEAYNKLKLKMD